MSAYYIAGSNGTGKSTVGKVLQSRGFRVIETDFEQGLSGWFDIDTNVRIEASKMPIQPYSPQWVKSHGWMWNTDCMQRLLASVGDEPVFFCGGATNADVFYKSFSKRFGLYVQDVNILKTRLKAREPERWTDDSSELTKSLMRAANSQEYFLANDIIPIDSSRSPDSVADSILAQI